MGAGPVIGPRWVHQGPKRLYCITTIAEAPASSGFCLPWGLALRDCWAIFFWYLDCFKQSEIDMTALICTVTTAPRVFRSVLTKRASGGSNTPISLVTCTKLVVYRSLIRQRKLSCQTPAGPIACTLVLKYGNLMELVARKSVSFQWKQTPLSQCQGN